MGEWKEVFLRDICSDISYGYTASATSENTGVKFLRITDIVNSPFNWNTVPFCNINSKDAEKYKLFPGDIVIARTGATTGTTFTISDNTNAVYASYLIRYKIDQKKANPYFIGHNLKSDLWKGYVENIIGGSAQPGANAQQFADFELLLPPLPEQERIAEVLSSLDDKIDLLHRQNKTLEEMAETLFRQWFVEEAKEKWRIGKINHLVNILSGFAFKSSSFVERGSYRLITIKGVQDGYLELANADQIDILPSNLPEYCKLQIGDILLSLTGNVGRCCLVDAEHLLLNQRVAKIVPKNTRDLAFTYFLFRQPSFRLLLEEMAKGTAQANLSPIEASNMEFQIPDQDTLEEYSLFTSPLLEKILLNKQLIKTLILLRDSLLPKLMSGQINVLTHELY